jgi:hypothetical protein
VRERVDALFVGGDPFSSVGVSNWSTSRRAINHQTARMLGLTVPDKLLVAADEVIE